MFELEFHGAAGGEVTGSMHLLHLDDGPVGLDCGLFQGSRTDARRKNLAFPVAPKELKALLLSHAHIDHSGNIPAWTHKGFSGPIYATAATCDLCNVMLADSAKIQEEDARFWNEKRARTPDEFIEPLYTAKDAAAAQKLFRSMPYDKTFPFARNARARFIEAGHILGSAGMVIEVSDARPISLLYTGDLGRQHMPILRDPTCPLPKVDYLITESTYAGKHHHDTADLKEQLVRIITQTRAAGGKVIIPAFSVGRTQAVVYYLAQAIAEGSLQTLPIYVDSPLSTNATEVFKRHAECYDDEAKTLSAQAAGDIFGGSLVKYITSPDESKQLNEIKDPCVIIASSGMCEAGRILHHLKNNIENEANTVVIVGFQAQHTLGRRIVERREEVKIFGRMYKLLCRVEVMNGFSGHAGADEFGACLGPMVSSLKAAFVVHGEEPQRTAMKNYLLAQGCPKVFTPGAGERFFLT